VDLKGEIYLRPATPVRFIFDEALASVDRLAEAEGREICFAHTWMHPDAKAMLRRYRNQMFHWRDTISGQIARGRENLMERCAAALIQTDESLKLLHMFNGGEREREDYFIRNSIQGFIEDLTPPAE
jgi:hypothetical protein